MDRDFLIELFALRGGLYLQNSEGKGLTVPIERCE